MVGKAIFVEPHGGDVHCVAILLSKIILRDRGYKEVDASALQRKGLYPGIPDVLVDVPVRGTNERGQAVAHGTLRAIIEIEVDATKKSIERKKAQYDTSLAGHELYVINLQLCENPFDITTLRLFLEKWLP
jgi:hypothetical protein